MHRLKPTMIMRHERPRPSPHIKTLPVRRVRDILIHMLPDLTLVTIDELLSSQLARLYILAMSDGKNILLSYAPSLTVRLLRHETAMLSSEASLVQFLNEHDPSNSLHSDQRSSDVSQTITKLVPNLLKHSANNREMAYPYSLFEAPSGDTLPDLATPLTAPETASVNKQVGILARALACVISPTGTFGAVDRVLSDQHVKIPNARKGLKTWSEGFNHLLEGVLRDGEDLFVLLPYETVRSHFKQASWHLDKVLEPRLLILDLGAEGSVLVEREIDGELSTPRLTGLRSWSQGVFGDPLLSSCFEDPSDGFLEGWEQEEDDVIEDCENADVRIMLYRCFRAIVGIVTEFYRPRRDSSRREMEGRRRLTSALAELEKMNGGVSEDLKRARSMPKEVGISKRIKTEGRICT